MLNYLLRHNIVSFRESKMLTGCGPKGLESSKHPEIHTAAKSNGELACPFNPQEFFTWFGHKDHRTNVNEHQKSDNFSTALPNITINSLSLGLNFQTNSLPNEPCIS